MWILAWLACTGTTPAVPDAEPAEVARVRTGEPAEVALVRTGEVLVSIGYMAEGTAYSREVAVEALVGGARVAVTMLVFADDTLTLLDAGRLCAKPADLRAAARPNTYMSDGQTHACGSATEGGRGGAMVPPPAPPSPPR